MYKIEEGEFVTNGNRLMIVRLHRGNGPKGEVFCEWTDPESGELCEEWIHRFDLNPYTPL
jgi:hypothetical protein